MTQEDAVCMGLLARSLPDKEWKKLEKTAEWKGFVRKYRAGFAAQGDADGLKARLQSLLLQADQLTKQLEAQADDA